MKMQKRRVDHGGGDLRRVALVSSLRSVDFVPNRAMAASPNPNSLPEGVSLVWKFQWFECSKCEKRKGYGGEIRRTNRGGPRGRQPWPPLSDLSCMKLIAAPQGMDPEDFRRSFTGGIACAGPVMTLQLWSLLAVPCNSITRSSADVQADFSLTEPMLQDEDCIEKECPKKSLPLKQAEKNELREEKVVLKEDKERIELQLKAQGNGYCFIFINWPRWLLLRKDGEAG
ncbi:hypothetical protein RHGRI_025325 [Rhododendron griersonianum]|uniref:Uncharacterized protein n=1 Tax=Rhododendron griersonianum TaxID=479676 RepID=A0AAV6IP02_9ERIC|nr:hypothetical protein RHGRI_025325 [Rhododendron griersonianum]